MPYYIKPFYISVSIAGAVGAWPSSASFGAAAGLPGASEAVYHGAVPVGFDRPFEADGASESRLSAGMGEKWALQNGSGWGVAFKTVGCNATPKDKAMGLFKLVFLSLMTEMKEGAPSFQCHKS